MTNKPQGYGAGSMSERPPGSGVWRLRVYLGRDPLTGQPVQRQETFRGNETAARKALAALVTKAEKGKFDRSNATVGQLLDRWLEHITPIRRPSTIAGYRAKIDHAIRPALGDVRLAKLTAAELDRCYRAWQAKGLAPATVRQYHAILSAALHQAEKWDYIDRSPTRRASPPAPRGAVMKVPTPEQLTELVAAAEESEPVLATAIALAALTGMRRGELCALRWSDVDLEGGTVAVERGITVIEGETHIGPTKTHQARRVALDDVGTAVLCRRWAFMKELADRAESPLVADPYVLSYNAKGGRPVNPDTVSHRFAGLCAGMRRAAAKRRKVKVDDLPADQQWPFRFHDLRHFSVTTLIAAGVDVRTVAERHGHAQATMTLNRYAHALPERDREAAGVLGRALDIPPPDLSSSIRDFALGAMAPRD
jgi:integrase